jgi:hypothetical protein
MRAGEFDSGACLQLKENFVARTLVSYGSLMNVLVIDVGGTHVKVLVSGEREPRKFVSGPTQRQDKWSQE